MQKLEEAFVNLEKEHPHLKRTERNISIHDLPNELTKSLGISAFALVGVYLGEYLHMVCGGPRKTPIWISPQLNAVHPQQVQLSMPF